MQLNLNGLKDRAGWQSIGVKIPDYDIPTMVERTREHPVWVHFGAGNIFRGYVANLQNTLLNAGRADRGIVAVDSSDGDQITRVYRPYDNLFLLVSLHGDGSSDREIAASIAEAIHAEWKKPDQWARLKTVFSEPGLQLCSFTITEKGYVNKGEEDFTGGPEAPVSVMAKVAALLYTRFQAGRLPLAVVSMDNCSHNGEKLRNSVLQIVEAWTARGMVPAEFLDYVSDESVVSFPWSMIDKITPRPNREISEQLGALGIEGMEILIREKGIPIAPFVNAESSQYLVIEDNFPNGRPSLEDAGVYLTDRETVNKTERMKVTTCLNPLHTALAVLGCLLGYDRIYKEMRDEDLRKLVERIGHVEGMPVVTNPGIMNPEDFLNEVLTQRLPNPYIPDMPQRIACDTSQKIPVRFGETIKSYLESDTLDLNALEAIPFALAGWLRYLLSVDDKLRPMELSADPMIPELQACLSGVRAGDPDSLQGQLSSILSRAEIFGADLTKTPLATKVENYFRAMLRGEDAVRNALHELVETF